MPQDFDKTSLDISTDAPSLSSQPPQRGKPPSYPCLEVVSGPDEGRMIPLKMGEQTFGRKEADHLLEDSSVSRRHALIIHENGHVAIQDEGSRNGTFVNGVRLPRAVKKTINHLDQLKLGIYVLRLLTRLATDAEIAAVQTRKKEDSKQASFVATTDSGAGKKGEAGPLGRKLDVSAEALENEERLSEEAKEEVRQGALMIPPVSQLPEGPLGLRLKVLFFVICLISGLAGLYFFYAFKNVAHEEDEENVEKVEVVVPPEPAPPVDTPVAPPVSPPISPRSFPAFLDIKTQPTTARLFFEGKFLGNSPLKTSVELLPGKTYTVTAEYELKDLNDRYQQKMTFVAKPGEEVVPLSFDAEIGKIKVLRLPRNVQFYLEGYYAYDRQKANPVKIDHIVYGRPIFVPFGHYNLDLREKVKMGDSQNTMDETRYHREFDLDASRREVELAIEEQDLTLFPAKIVSNPSGAEVFIDEKSVGKTPFSGNLPLGRHALKLVREGYFDHEQPLDVRTNVPFETNVEMKTSRAGELINRARALRQSGQNEEVIQTLVEVLKLDTGAKEKADVHYLLGNTYFVMGNLAQSQLYLEQAKTHPDLYFRAVVGLSRVQHAMGDVDLALKTLLDVLLNAPAGDPAKQEAQSFFKQLSPIKSVIYVSTEPAGATVFVNNREMERKTPLVLPELGLGSYRLEIQKGGFKTEQVKKELKFSEFVPIILKLKPEGL